MPKNKIINVNIVIDTTRLMTNYPNPSKDQNNPTGIDHTYQYMVVSDNASISGQGTGDLSIQATQGDIVRFYATSEYNNYDQPVILYKLFKFGGTDVFMNPNFELQNFPGSDTIVPTGFNPLVTQKSTANFWFAQNTVNQKGTENYGLCFGLYDSNMNLFGFFSWDPAITAK